MSVLKELTFSEVIYLWATSGWFCCIRTSMGH